MTYLRTQPNDLTAIFCIQFRYIVLQLEKKNTIIIALAFYLGGESEGRGYIQHYGNKIIH